MSKSQILILGTLLIYSLWSPLAQARCTETYDALIVQQQNYAAKGGAVGAASLGAIGTLLNPALGGPIAACGGFIGYSLAGYRSNLLDWMQVSTLLKEAEAGEGHLLDLLVAEYEAASPEEAKLSPYLTKKIIATILTTADQKELFCQPEKPLFTLEQILEELRNPNLLKDISQKVAVIILEAQEP